MARIKLCGLTRAGDISAANACMPDYAGFVFVPSSKRFVTTEAAWDLRAALHSAIIPVGVFVNDTVEHIARLHESGIISIAQLHGSEDAGFRQALKDRCGVPIIQAIRVSAGADVNNAGGSSADVNALIQAALNNADYVLFDASTAGSGRTFDWSVLDSDARSLLRERGFLAGGISESTIGAALELQPFAVDTSSGAETNGVKDARKMTTLTAAAHGGIVQGER